MQLEPEQRARVSGSVSWWARLRLLPGPVLLIALLLFVSALAPAASELISLLGQDDGPVWLGPLIRHPGIVSGAGVASALGVLLVVERPEGWSVAAYARQLRNRAAAVQAGFDGALRRRARRQEEDHHAPRSNRLEP